jgi:hypothetical protein
MSRRKQPPPEPTRLTLLDRMIIPLLTALVAFGASYLAATIGADTQQITLAEQRRKEDRDKRSEVYMAYLDALTDYAPLFHAATTCLRDSAPSGLLTSIPTKCQDALATDPKPLRQLKLAYNRVQVLGSINVIQKVYLVHEAILVFVPEEQHSTASQPPEDPNLPVLVPNSPRSSTVPPPPPPPPPTPAEKAKEFEAKYRAAYGDFVNAMCADLSVDPGARCTR